MIGFKDSLYYKDKSAKEARMVDIKKKLEKGLISYRYLMQLARSDPYDKIITYFFINEYNKIKKYDISARLSYLQLKYLYEEPKQEFLNEIAQIYISQNKKFLAFMCLVESLRLQPQQPEIFRSARSLEEYTKAIFPKNLRENKYSISVIMATYNRTETISEAIKSVLNQTFKDFELIIINDGGTDKIKKIVESFCCPKIKYYKLEKNKGLRAALNEGILKAEGKFISYLDDDDVYYPTHLENLLHAFSKTHKKIIYSSTKMVNGVVKEGKFKAMSLNKIFNYDFDRDKLLLDFFIPPISIMHYKSIFNDAGLFTEDKANAFDWEMWLRMSLKFDMEHLRDVTCEWRLKQDNTTVKNHLETQFIIRMIRKYYTFHKGKTAYINYYLNNNEKRKGYDLYTEIINDYPNYFKAKVYLKELLEIAKYFKDEKFIIEIIRNHFRYNPRYCLREIIACKSAPVFNSVVPLLPYGIVKRLKEAIINNA